MIRHALRARHYFPLAPRHQAAHQAVKYARALAWLGTHWILYKKVERKEVAA